MGTHRFYLIIEVGGRDIDSAAKKLAFIEKRAAVERVTCTDIECPKGLRRPVKETMPFRKGKADPVREQNWGLALMSYVPKVLAALGVKAKRPATIKKVVQDVLREHTE